MSNRYAAMRGKMGTTTYYVLLMDAGDVVNNIVMPSQVPGWKQLSIDEKWQRKVQDARVIGQIAPYFAKDPNRFTGSLIAAALNLTAEELDRNYHPVSEVAEGFQGYEREKQDVGFLQLSGADKLVPIDGQHRLKAFKYAINGKTGKNGSTILRANPAVAKDKIVVVVMAFETKKCRMIFNKVNQYARKTSKADNIITDDDDLVAVITRRMTIPEKGLIPGHLILERGNTLSPKAAEFTTLATLYDINCAVMESINEGKNAPKSIPQPYTEEMENLYEREIFVFWEKLINGIDDFHQALEDTDDSGDETRRTIRQSSLLGKPVGQNVMARAYLRLEDPKKGKMKSAEALKALNGLGWAIDDTVWRGVLTREGGRVLTGVAVAKLGARFAAYLAGESLTKEEKEDLREAVGGKGNVDYQLPTPKKGS